MGHVYQQTIEVTAGVTAAGEARPERLVWRGQEYRVAEVLSTWRLRDRWWEELPPLGDTVGDGSGDARGDARGDVLPDGRPETLARGVQRGHGPGPGFGRRLGGASERTYWRVRCEEGLICDVYEDAARGVGAG